MEQKVFLFSNCALINNKLFFVETQSGLLANMNLEDGKIAFCPMLKGYFLRSGDIVDFICNYNNKIYALETSGKNIMIFDMEQNGFQEISLECDFYEWGNFVAFERYNTSIYIFPKYKNSLFIMSIKDNKVIKVTDYFENIEEVQCCCRIENLVWILPKSVSKIGAYNLSNEELSVYDLNLIPEICVDAVNVDENIYFLNRYGIIYQWNTINKKMKKLLILETKHIDKESMCKIISAGNKLVMLPALGKNIKILNLLTYEVEIYQDYPIDFLYNDIKWSKYCGYCQDDENYYFAMRLSNYLLTIRKCDGNLSWIKPKIPLENEKKKIQALYEEEKVRIYHNIGRTVFGENDINIITLSKAFPCNENNLLEGKQIGKIIYEKVK